MRLSEGGRRRREWRWPLLGVVSVLLPALVFAAVAYRAEKVRHDRALAGIASASPEELTRIYLEAQSDDWDDVIAAASLSEREAAESLRGLRIESLEDARPVSNDSSPGAPAQVAVGAHISTVRVQATGEAPGPETLFVRLQRKGGRWYVSETATAP